MNWKSLILSIAIIVGVSYPVVATEVPDVKSAVFVARDHGGHGSGVLVAPDTVITAAHILLVEGGAKDTYSIITFTGEKVAVSQFQFPGNDVAILTLKHAVKVPVAVISCESSTIGETLYGVGFPYSLEFVTVPLFVSADMKDVPEANGPKEKDTVMVHTALLVTGPLLLGQSGGPVFNKDQKLVGIQIMQFLGDNNELTGLGAIVPSTVFPQCKQ